MLDLIISIVCKSVQPSRYSLIPGIIGMYLYKGGPTNEVTAMLDLIFSMICKSAQPSRYSLIPGIMGMYLYKGGATNEVSSTLCKLLAQHSDMENSHLMPCSKLPNHVLIYVHKDDRGKLQEKIVLQKIFAHHSSAVGHQM